MTFEELVAICEKAGEPFHAMSRKNDGTYQASLRSGYDPAKAFACDSGPTPTLALLAVAIQRRHVKAISAPKISASDLF